MAAGLAGYGPAVAELRYLAARDGSPAIAALARPASERVAKLEAEQEQRRSGD